MQYDRIENKRICICTVTSTDFIPGTLVLLHSFKIHNKWFDGDIVIISDKLSPEIKNQFRIFPNVIFHEPGFEILLRIGHLCNAIPAMYQKRKRFYSLEAFQLSEYEQVLFFDSDMLVTGNIYELCQSNHSLMACSDVPNQNSGKVRDRNTFKRIVPDARGDKAKILSKTFNAGFLAIANEHLNNKTYSELISLINSNTFISVQTHNTDQVILNLFFDEMVNLLPFTYNMILSKWPLLRTLQNIKYEDIKIMHFTGNYKPWLPGSVRKEFGISPDFKAFYNDWQLAMKEVEQQLKDYS
jgi:lipopolysaccharide biosynthesis glycosyltransferase